MRRLLLVGLVLAGTLLSTSAAQAVGACGVESAPTVAGTNTIDNTPRTWATTNGYVQSGELLGIPGGTALAIGGKFTTVTEPDGHVVAAQNVAVIRVATGRVIYAGNANGNVRALSALWGLLYVAGKFTTIDGKARNYVAQIDTATWQVTGWNPGSAGALYALATSGDGVFYAGSSALRRVNIFNGQVAWVKNAQDGPIRSLMTSLDGSFLLVGGLFESYDGYVKHGLISVSPATGVPDRSFAANFRPDSGVGTSGSYDGDGILNQAWNWNPADGLRLIPCIGSATFNTVRALEPYGRAQYWYAATEGDCQAVASVGNTIVAGWHRNHGNGTGCPWAYYGNQLSAHDGTIITSWDPRLTGTQSSDGGEQNNGVHDIVVDGGNGVMFMLGAFTLWNGAPRQSIAVYGVH